MNKDQVRVLLIEDDSTDLEMVRRSLRRSGLSVDLCWEPTMTGGITKLRDERFDLVLSDISLPDSQGRETVESIRRHASHTPIVVLTGLNDGCFESELLGCGAEDYLLKDEITPSGLKRVIRHAIQRHEYSSQIHDLLSEVRTQRDLLKKKNIKLAKLFDQAHEFVDNVSHEFRTPLTVVKEYVSLIREGLVGEVNDEQKRLLNVAEDRANDLNTMVDDMLDISKLEAGMLGAWRKNCRVDEITQHVLDSIQRKANIKNVKLQWQIEPGLPEVYCDAEKAGRVITNLAINAIKFCGDPGVVEIGAAANFDAGEVRVWISDNGPGIDSESLSAIFRRFQQVGQSIRSSTKGFGLGLNIAKELVDLNFGAMDVESTPGEGSTFSFTLPLADPLEVMDRYVNRLRRLGEEDTSKFVSVIEATIPVDHAIGIDDDVDAFLSYCLRKNDLVFRLEPQRWIIVLPEPRSELDSYFDRIHKELSACNRNRPFGMLPDIDMSLAECWGIDDDHREYCRGIFNLAASHLIA
tara:strand:+ start:1111137 stop:1112702 length:1566 start_codon:yes stop_codon:yes gene_type:complete